MQNSSVTVQKRSTGLFSHCFDSRCNLYQQKRTAKPSDFVGGDKGSRTPDLLNAIQALSQLSYTPKWLRCFLDNDDIISQRLLFVNRFLKSFFRKNQLVRRCQNKESSTLFRWLTRQTIPPTPVGRINKICPCFFMLPQALFP